MLGLNMQAAICRCLCYHRDTAVTTMSPVSSNEPSLQLHSYEDIVLCRFGRNCLATWVLWRAMRISLVRTSRVRKHEGLCDYGLSRWISSLKTWVALIRRVLFITRFSTGVTPPHDLCTTVWPRHMTYVPWCGPATWPTSSDVAPARIQVWPPPQYPCTQVCSPRDPSPWAAQKPGRSVTCSHLRSVIRDLALACISAHEYSAQVSRRRIFRRHCIISSKLCKAYLSFNRSRYPQCKIYHCEKSRSKFLYALFKLCSLAYCAPPWTRRWYMPCEQSLRSSLSSACSADIWVSSLPFPRYIRITIRR